MAKSFRNRGGIWVVVQWGLMGGAVLLGPLDAGADCGGVVRSVAILLLVAGSAFGIAGAVTMGRVRTVYPEPPENSRLIDTGIYALVRHPIYTSLIFLSFGWALAWNSGAGFAMAVVMLFFLVAKSGEEERRLRKRFPEYETYMRTTKRLIPWIY